MNVFERVQNAYFKFLDDIKNGKLKGVKPKKETFVKGEDIPAGNLIYSVSNKLDSKPSKYIKYDGILPYIMYRMIGELLGMSDPLMRKRNN